MMSRTQLSLEPELLRRAKSRAASLGVSLAEYVRRLLVRDLQEPDRVAEPSAVFNLGSSGGSDIGRDKDALIAQAIAAERGLAPLPGVEQGTGARLAGASTKPRGRRS